MRFKLPIFPWDQRHSSSVDAPLPRRPGRRLGSIYRVEKRDGGAMQRVNRRRPSGRLLTSNSCLMSGIIHPWFVGAFGARHCSSRTGRRSVLQWRSKTCRPRWCGANTPPRANSTPCLLVGWDPTIGMDPDYTARCHSKQIPVKDGAGSNYVQYQNPEVDRLLELGVIQSE